MDNNLLYRVAFYPLTVYTLHIPTAYRLPPTPTFCQCHRAKIICVHHSDVDLRFDAYRVGPQTDTAIVDQYIHVIA